MMHHLTRLGVVDQVYVDQCTLGAPSRKPTILGTVRLPQLRVERDSRPSKCRCKCKEHAKVLTGLDEDGTFRTAPAKAYPPDMCLLIAKAIHAYVKEALVETDCNLPQWPEDLQRFYQPLDPYIRRETGMDCAMFNDSSHEDFKYYEDAAHTALVQLGLA